MGEELMSETLKKKTVKKKKVTKKPKAKPKSRLEVDQITILEPDRPHNPNLPKNYYFDNEYVEKLLTEYVYGGCTDIYLRDKIMSNASELIRQIIRTHKLHTLTTGKEGTAFGDLYQIAWVQVESSLYKFDGRVGHTKVFNMWCVSPDTLLITDEGLRTIDDCVGDDSIGVASFNVYGSGGLNKATAYLKRPSSRTLKLTTAQGYSVECTPEHKIMTLTANGTKWRPASELGKGDLLPIQFGQQCFGTNDATLDIALTKRGLWSPPPTITDELAYIIGLYIAEGSWSYGKFVIYNIDQDVIDKLINNNLGLNFIHEPKYQRVSLCDVRFIEFMKSLGFVDDSSADTKSIPPRILKCSKDVIKNVLKGMFDGDGHSSINDGCVGYTSTSKTLIDQLRVLLLNFGIITTTSYDHREESKFEVNGKKYTSKKKLCYQLEAPTYYSEIYYNNIGFGIKRKQLKAKFLKNSRRMLPLVFINWVQNLVNESAISNYVIDKKTEEPNRKHGIQVHNILKRKAGITKKVLGVLLDAYKSESHLNSYQVLKERFDESDNILWLPINSIEESESETIDIEVPAVRSYTANGIIVSNSQVAKTVMLAHIKKESRDKRNYGAYKDHLDAKHRPGGFKFERFLIEARNVCKYSACHLQIVNTLEELYNTDDKPFEGLIDKLVRKSGISRSKVSAFLRMVRLRAFEFSDSPVNNKPAQDENKYRVINANYENDDD